MAETDYLGDPLSASNPENPFYNPYYYKPTRPHHHRRARHHDYTRPSRYLITIMKNPAVPAFCRIDGDPSYPSSTRVDLSLAGEAIAAAIEEWKGLYPVYVPTYVIMPDHVHICVDVHSILPQGLGRAMARLMGKVTNRYHTSLPEHLRPSEKIPVFTKGFNDRIAYTQQQWMNQQRYTDDNPRRYLIKRKYPDFLRRRWLLTMPGNRCFVLLGNIFLLKEPEVFQVKTSRHFTPAEAANVMAGWEAALYNDAVPISPFIHPHEKALKEKAIREECPYIRVCTNGFGERESASGVEFELMAQGMVLLVAPLEHNDQKIALRYEYAQSLNSLAAEIADCCCRGVTLAIRPL